MAFTTAALKSEFASDPAGVGYASALAAANDVQLAALINALTGPGAANVFRNDIQPLEVINAILTADFTALTTNQILQIQLMFLGGVLDATNANVRANFNAIFSGKTTTLANLAAVAQRTGSRAEALFGTGFVVTPAMCSQAR